MEAKLEKATAKRLDLQIQIMVRNEREWGKLISNNPFPKEAKRDPGHLVVLFLKQAPEKEAVASLRAAIKGPEKIECIGSQLYITYPKGIGTSRLTNAALEAKLGQRGTGRNWNTVLKLACLLTNGSL